MEQFNLEMNGNEGELALMQDEKTKIGRILLQKNDNVLTATSTLVYPAFEGQGQAKKLFNELVKYARENKFKIVPKCPYILAQFEKAPESFQDIWA